MGRLIVTLTFFAAEHAAANRTKQTVNVTSFLLLVLSGSPMPMVVPMVVSVTL